MIAIMGQAENLGLKIMRYEVQVDDIGEAGVIIGGWNAPGTDDKFAVLSIQAGPGDSEFYAFNGFYTTTYELALQEFNRRRGAITVAPNA